MVKFLVQNSLGALWVGMHPESGLAKKWKYYVHDAERTPPVHEDPIPFDVKEPPLPGPDPWVRPKAHIPIEEIVIYARTLTVKVPEAQANSFHRYPEPDVGCCCQPLNKRVARLKSARLPGVGS